MSNNKKIVPVSDWKDRMFQHAITGCKDKAPDMPVSAAIGFRTGQLVGHAHAGLESLPWLGEGFKNMREGYTAGQLLVLKRYDASRAARAAEKAAKETREMAHKAVKKATQQNLEAAARVKTKEMTDAVIEEITQPDEQLVAT